MKTLKVAGAIIYRDGRIMAAHRSGSHGHVGWEFPGGKLESGETAEQALRREVSEELGLRLTNMWLFDTVEHDYPDFHLSMDCFVCPLDEGQEPALTEHDRVRWLSYDELLDVDWLGADHTVALRLGMFWDQLFAAEHL